MICIGLERFFELPIIQAPKRNSKLHSEMWTNSFLPSVFWARGPACATLHEALTSDTPVSSPGARPRAWEPEIANDCFRPRKSAFEGRSLVGPGGDGSKPLKSTGRGLAHRVDRLLLLNCG